MALKCLHYPVDKGDGFIFHPFSWIKGTDLFSTPSRLPLFWEFRYPLPRKLPQPVFFPLYLRASPSPP